MKIPWKKTFYFVMFLGSLVGFKNAVGQNDSIHNKNIESNLSENCFQITGVVKDSIDNEPIPFCNIVINDKYNRQINGTISDFDGKFKLYPIPKGNYTINATFVGYKPISKKISVNNDTTINIKLFPTMEDLPQMCYVFQFRVPLIDPRNTTTGETIGSEDIRNMPIRR